MGGLVDIRKQCNTVSLAEHITAARLRWFGHILRMEHGRIPHIALFSTLWGKSRPRGRPPMRWTTLVSRDLQQQQMPTNMHELLPHCEMRACWRSMVYKITHPGSVGVRHQRSRDAAYRQQWRLNIRAQRLQPLSAASAALQAARVAEAWAMHYR